MSMALSDQVGARIAKMRGVKDGFTARELGAKEGISLSTAQELLRGAIELGLAEYAGKRPRVTISGQRQFVPIYRLKGKA